MKHVDSYLFHNLKLPPEQLFARIAQETSPQVLRPPGSNFIPADIDDPPQEMARPIGLFSSGTTGRPKCIWNSYSNLLLNAKLSSRAFELRGGDRLLFMAKPWHVAGFTWVLMEKFVDVETQFLTTKKGEQESWLKAIHSYRPTHLFTVPAVLRSLLDEDDWFVPNIVYGGAPIQHNDYRQFQKHADTLYQGYGQTEAGGLISCHKVKVKDGVAEGEHHCLGRAIAGALFRCEGTKQHPAAIHLKSPTAVYRDYYDTGDLGYLDDQNNLYLVDRQEAGRTK